MGAAAYIATRCKCGAPSSIYRPENPENQYLVTLRKPWIVDHQQYLASPYGHTVNIDAIDNKSSPKSFGKSTSLPLHRRMHSPTMCASCSLSSKSTPS